MNTSPDDWIGKTLGPYEILAEIGRGGMATVYRARQPSINRIIAIKVLPHSFLHDPDFLERFRREVDVIAHLEHPHIVPIYDYGEAAGVPYIAMRYLPGGSLSQRLRRGRPALAWLEQPLTQIARALDYAHQHGVIHRDLKPANILLDDEDNAYLTDFGIARVIDSRLTGSAIVGTPAYMSPEQANGQPLDGRSDVYALGLVLFELIAGREPFEGRTPMALMLQQIHEPMPSVRAFRPDAPPAVDEVIAHATAKNPDDRYPSAGELAAAYRAALRTGSGSVEDATTIHIASTPRSATKPAPIFAPTLVEALPPSTPEPARRQRPAKALIATLVVVALIAAVAVGAALRFGAARAPVLPTQTPFPGGRIDTTRNFRVAVPQDWSEQDFSTDARPLVVWKPANGLASVVVATMSGPFSDFDGAVKAYDATYGSTTGRSLIDQSTAPDGSLRRSYRVVSGPTAPGQVDVFYLHRIPYLTVVETYSADATGNLYVAAFQSILDSVAPIAPPPG